jgi:hypothetical protein
LPIDLPELDPKKITLTSLKSRHSKVSAADFGKALAPGGSFKGFIDSLPNILSAKDLKDAALAIAKAHKAGKTVMLAMGGHPVKVGLNPLIISLLEKGLISSISGNGSVMVHDSEIALNGSTSEDVSGTLDEGAFGVTDETGSLISLAARNAARDNLGLGKALGQALLDLKPAYADLSLFCAAYKLKAPLTVHVALGTDVYNIHPDADGAALGKASMDDFLTFSRLVATLEDGVFINLGSAVIMPEVFLKAVSLTRNLGFRQPGLTTINMDFIHQYRTRVNVVERPTHTGGKGYNLVGHHEIMFPLLMNMALEYLESGEAR